MVRCGLLPVVLGATLPGAALSQFLQGSPLHGSSELRSASQRVARLSAAPRRAALVQLDLASYPDARCLDNSPGAYYLEEALDESSADKWVISLQGGGECTTDVSCTLRRYTDLGSSNHYRAAEGELPQLASSNHEENPAMHSWHHVRLMYCSGDLHLGTMSSSDAPKWGWARFAGARIVSAMLDDLSKTRNLSAASVVVWTGDSAGGIGAFAHLDQVADLLPSVRIVGAPVAGYYWDNALPYTGPGHGDYVPFGKDGFQALFNLYRAFVPRRCAEGPHKTEPWVCALADYSFDTLASPVFVIEAEVDKVQLELHSGVTCDPHGPDYPAQANYCLQWGRNMTLHLQKVAERARQNSSRAGLFAPACRLHTEFNRTGPLLAGLTYSQAFSKFLEQHVQAQVNVDDCCSGSTIQYQSTCLQAAAVADDIASELSSISV